MPRVVVLGSSGYDLTIALNRLPRPGETLLGGTLHQAPGGKGANQAIAARRAGAEVQFVTAFGDDDFGKRASQNCRDEGLDLGHALIVAHTANQVALILVGEAGQNLIAVAPGASMGLTPLHIDALPDSLFEPGGVFLASLEVPLATVAHALARARGAGMTTVLNPAPADLGVCDRSFLSLVDILTPNEEEFATLARIMGQHERGQGFVYLREQGARVVVVTLGEDGCLIFSDTSVTTVPAPKVVATDTVGAGDAFNGAIAAALADGKPLIDAARWACCAGAIAVTQPGAQGAIPDRPQIDQLYRKICGDSSGS